MMGRIIAIGAWILASAVYAAMLSWSLPTLSAFAGGLPVFDMMPSGYSLPQAKELVAALGAEGRAFYLGPQHWLDTAYPPLLGLAFALSFRLLFRGHMARALVTLVAIAAGFDLLENAVIVEVLNTDSAALTKDMVVYASRLTIAKSVFTTLAFVALLTGLARAVWQRFSQRTPQMA